MPFHQRPVSLQMGQIVKNEGRLTQGSRAKMGGHQAPKSKESAQPGSEDRNLIDTHEHGGDFKEP
jgi:hypothetical protein